MRVKRKNQTIFLHVEPSDNFASLKAKCGETLNVPPTSVQLLHTDKARARRERARTRATRERARARARAPSARSP